MKVDLSRDGLSMFFKPWQIPIIKELLREPSRWKSAEVCEYVNGLLKKEGKKISRASVIFFLRDMALEGFLDYEEETGKGGHHRVYWGVMTVPEFLECVRCQFNEKIDKMLGENKQANKTQFDTIIKHGAGFPKIKFPENIKPEEIRSLKR